MIVFLKRLHLFGIWRRICLFLVNKCFAGTKYFAVKRKLLRAIGHEIGLNTKVVAPITCFGHLKIGDDCWIGRNFTVNGNGFVSIGDCCDIAPDVSFLTGGHQIGSSQRRAGEGESYTIQIGNGVWIGSRTTLLCDINVGDGAVVAACSCVNKNVEKNALVAGVPAQVKRNLDCNE